MNRDFKKTALKALLPALMMAQPVFASVRSSSVSRNLLTRAVVVTNQSETSEVSELQAGAQANPFAAFGQTNTQEQVVQQEPAAETLAFLADQGLLLPQAEQQATESGHNFDGRKMFASLAGQASFDADCDATGTKPEWHASPGRYFFRWQEQSGNSGYCYVNDRNKNPMSVAHQVGVTNCNALHLQCKAFAASDTTPPNVTSLTLEDSPAVNASSVTFRVTFNKSVAGVSTDDFELASTGSASGTINSVSFSGYTALVSVGQISGEGTLRLDLRAATNIVDGDGNGNGNSGYTPAYTSGAVHTVDLVAPAAPSTPDLASSSDSGASNSDNLTNDTTPTFTGTAEVGATVLLYASGAVVGSVAADGGGNWTITSSTLAAGTYAFTARAQDVAGNLSAPSSSLTVNIDTTGPVVSAPDMVAASDSGSSNTDNITNVHRPEFTGTAPAGTLVQLFIDNAGNGDATDPLNEIIGTGTAVAGGTWSITSTAAATMRAISARPPPV
jgi:hypothetical protein